MGTPPAPISHGQVARFVRFRAAGGVSATERQLIDGQWKLRDREQDLRNAGRDFVWRTKRELAHGSL